jgi:hypothetical protein
MDDAASAKFRATAALIVAFGPLLAAMTSALVAFLALAHSTW